MSTNYSTHDLYQAYKNDYKTWRSEKDLQAAKRQEYLRRNPDAIKDYDLQRAKRLLDAVDMMDKSTSKKSDNIDIAFESTTSLGLGYAAIGGVSLGFLLTKLKYVKKAIEKIGQKYPKSKNIMPTAITTISGVVGVLLAYPIYNFLSNTEAQIYRKRRFETMEKELQDPKIFSVLDEEQKTILENNLSEIKKEEKNKKTPSKIVKSNLRTIIDISKETLNYSKEQTQFAKKYNENKDLYDKTLSEKDIKAAKKDKVLLSILIREINTSSQSYKEKMQRITDNLITLSFALGSLFTLGYERIAQKLKFKSSSLPAGMGVALLIGSTFFATWAQKRATHVGRFKAKQDLIQNPEQLVYISNKKTDTIDDSEIKMENKKKMSSIKFLKEFFEINKQYNEWKKSERISGKDLSKALADIEITPEQLQDGKRLQKNMFKTFYKVDSNTQNYSNKIDVLNESVKFPLTLLFGTIGSVWGMKHLAKLRNSISPKEIFKNSIKYIGTITLFTVPSLILNSYFAKAQKMGARISDMMTMKEMEDYRFFADYSKYVK